MKQKTLMITNILVNKDVGVQILSIIGSSSASEPIIQRTDSGLNADGCSREVIEGHSQAADMARRITVLVNTKARWIESIKPLGAPLDGILIPVVGRYNEIEVKVIRATLKRIAKTVFSVDEACLSGPAARGTHIKIIRSDSARSSVGKSSEPVLFGLSGDNLLSDWQIFWRGLGRRWHKASFFSNKLNALNKPAKIAGAVALYGFAAFGVFATVAMLTHASKAMSAAHDEQAEKGARDAQDFHVSREAAANAAASVAIPEATEAPPAAPVRFQQQSSKVSPPKDIEIVTGEADAPQHRFYVFSDPLCPYCKEFEPVLEKVAARHGFEMHLFPTPLHDGARALVSQIACAKKRGLAWHESITDEKVTGSVLCPDGESAPSRALAFFHSINLEGTPTVINESGIIHTGGFGTEGEMIQFLERSN